MRRSIQQTLALGLVLITVEVGQTALTAQDPTPASPAAEPALTQDDTPRPADAPEPSPETMSPPDASTAERRESGSEDLVRIGGDAEVKEGEEVRDLIVVMGSAVMDGKVNGDMVVAMGKARVNGEIHGSLVAPLTSVELGPNAHIHGEMVITGGALTADPAARVDGQRVELTWEDLEKKLPFLRGLRSVAEGLNAWVMKGLLWGRPLPHQWGWWWWAVMGAWVVYFLVGMLFQKPVGSGVQVIHDQPVAAFLAGLAGYILACICFMLLAVTGVGLLVLPFLFCGALVAQLLGKVAVAQAVGVQVGRQSGLDLLTQPLPGLLAGLAVLTLVMVVPIVGFLVAFVTAPLGFGGILLAMFRAFRAPREPAGPIGGAGGSTVAPPLSVTSTPHAPLEGVAPPRIDLPPDPWVGLGDIETLPRAGFWVRFAATFLDLLLIVAFLAVLNALEYFFLPWFAYHVGLWTWKGTTIGGIIFGLRIVRRDGRPLTFAVALVRCLASVLSGLALFIGFFWAGWTREKTAWHDLIAGTLIVRQPRGTPLI